MRSGVGQHRPGIAVNIYFAEKQEDQRDSEENKAWDGEQKMSGGIEVAKPLGKLQSGAEQGILDAQDLGHAAGPANALADVRGQALGGQARCLGNVNVCGVPAPALHAQSGMRIFSHRLHCDSADLIERRAAQHRARSAEETCIPQIVSILHQAVKKFALVGNSAELTEVSLKRIGRIEVMRRLHQSQAVVAKKPSQGCLQERAVRDVVAVEDGNEFTFGAAKRMIDVARLRVSVVIACYVF